MQPAHLNPSIYFVSLPLAQNNSIDSLFPHASKSSLVEAVLQLLDLTSCVFAPIKQRNSPSSGMTSRADSREHPDVRIADREVEKICNDSSEKSAAISELRLRLGVQ